MGLIGEKSRQHSLIRQGSQLSVGLESAADSEHVAIGMAKVHLADVPRHIGGRKCDLQPRGDAMLVHLVHVVQGRALCSLGTA
jgi:hypothetical protein